MATLLDTSHQEDHAGLAIKVKDIDISGAQTVGGNSVVTGNQTVTGNLLVTGTSTFTGAQTKKSPVISGTVTSATLTAAQSGSMVLFDAATGLVFTLPAPAVGLSFTFLVTVSVTSNSHKVITDAGTTLLIGSLTNIDTDTTNAVAAWTGNGSTHIAVTQNSAATNATGGLIGSYLEFRCVSATQWLVSGTIQGAGTVATPFATS